MRPTLLLPTLLHFAVLLAVVPVRVHTSPLEGPALMTYIVAL